MLGARSLEFNVAIIHSGPKEGLVIIQGVEGKLSEVKSITSHFPTMRYRNSYLFETILYLAFSLIIYLTFVHSLNRKSYLRSVLNNPELET